MAAGQTYRAGALTSANLQVAPGAFGPLPLAWIEPALARAQVTAMFPESLITADSPSLRVRVQQAGAPTAAVAKVRSELLLAGRTFVWAGPAPPRSASVVAVATAELQADGARVASSIGLPPSAVVVDPQATPGAPVTVILAPAAPAVPEADPASSGTASPAPTQTVASSAQ